MPKCAGLKRNGRLKKGFRWKKGGSCPQKSSGARKRAASGGALKVSKSKRSVKVSIRCRGLVKSGKRKGRLKKGFRWRKGSACPVRLGAC